MIGATESGGGAAPAAKIDAPKGPTPAEMARIRAAQQERFNLGKKGIGELQSKGVHFASVGDKKPADIVAEINGKGAGWRDDEPTRKYVQEAIDLQREVQIEAASIKLQKLIKKESVADEDVIAKEAEKNVLEKRIKASIPKAAESVIELGDEPPDVHEDPDDEAVDTSSGAKTPSTEEVKKREAGEEAKKKQDVKDADKAKNQATVDAMDELAKMGGSSRALLELIATQEAVNVAELQLQKAQKARLAVKNGEVDSANKKMERARKVLVAARKDLEVQTKKFEKLKTDPNAPVADRLFAYDMDIAQTNAELSVAQQAKIALQTELASASAEDQASVQEKYGDVDRQVKALEERATSLGEERKNVGSAQDQKINYVAAQVMSLTKDVPLKTGETTEQRNETIMTDPLGFMQEQINSTGMAKLLESSGISEKDQKQLLDISSAQKVERMVKGAEISKNIAKRGGQGFIGILLLLYVAYGTNKKTKGGGMG